jgi:hypothetical protein
MEMTNTINIRSLEVMKLEVDKSYRLHTRVLIAGVGGVKSKDSSSEESQNHET